MALLFIYQCVHMTSLRLHSRLYIFRYVICNNLISFHNRHEEKINLKKKHVGPRIGGGLFSFDFHKNNIQSEMNI